MYKGIYSIFALPMRWGAIFMFATMSIAQEVLLKKGYELLPQSATSANKINIALPFRDHFFEPSGFPSPTLWNNKGAHVARTLAAAPPDIGVVVLDGAAQNRLPYVNYTPSVGYSDTLESLPIDLSTWSPQDSLYLVFWIEKGGLADSAENNDSLILYFLNDSLQYQQIWSTSGSNFSTNFFTSVAIPITNPRFFHNAFQFRFVSKGSQNGGYDVWLLDKIELAPKNQLSDSLFNDIALQEIEGSPFGIYSIISLRAFQQLSNLTPIACRIYNNNAYATTIPLNLTIQTVLNNQSLPMTVVNQNVNLSAKSATQVALGGMTAPSWSKPERLIYTWTIASNNDNQIAVNDSFSLVFRVDSLLGYDDGEPEAGYGLNASSVFGQRFDFPLRDTLKGVAVQFYPTLYTLNGKPFELRIYQMYGDSVGELLYQSRYTIQIQNPPFSFYYYPLNELVAVQGSILIAFFQYDDKPLGVGFDRNRHFSGRYYQDLYGKWQKSSFQGSLCVRPIVLSGSYAKTLMVQERSVEKKMLLLYPNPSTSYITIESTDFIHGIVVYDVMGKEWLRWQGRERRVVLSTASLPKGLYMVKVIDAYGKRYRYQFIRI